MKIRVRLFASLAEQLGQRDLELETDTPLTVAEVWERLGRAEALPAAVLAAVNMEYVQMDQTVTDGDEVAFFPPVTGGSPITVRILDTPLVPWELVQQHEAQRLPSGGFGATAMFVGTMRDFNEQESVSEMHLEHYPGMTERHLERIARDAVSRWTLIDVLLVHRVGRLRPGDPIVLVAVWSAHRAEAFDACRHLMEDLKSRAPFWKREALPGGGHRWVERNTPGTTSEATTHGAHAGAAAGGGATKR